LIGEDVPTSSSPLTINAVTRGRSHMVSPCKLRGDGVIVEATALIDCGADGVFMHKKFASKNKISLKALETPIICRNVDGTLNREGNITHMASMEISIQGRTHMQGFLITGIGENDIILGMAWLTEQNPCINWKEQTINWSWWMETPEQTYQRWIKATKTEEKEVNPKDKVPKEFHEFLSVFSEEAASRMPKRKVWDHKIEIKEGFSPKSTGIYKLTPEEDAATQEFIKENLEKGYIRPSKSPMASPFFFVPKKDGKKRPCQDYRYINQWTVKNAYPLPLIDEIMDKLQGKKIFTKFDVRWGYNNVRIAEGDEWKAAFKTKHGLFEPTVMFFGLCNSPATFQNMMDHIFAEEIERGICIIYMDDILILAENEQELTENTKRILKKLKENDLYLKPEKCEFVKTEVEYLGMVVRPEQIAMDDKKVQAIKDWPAPRTVKEVRSFLGLGNFYRKFIRKYSDTAKPLNDLLKKDRPTFEWTEEAANAFEELKRKFCEEPVLKMPDPTRPFQIEADASKFAIGAVLTQLDSNGNRHPVAFLSKTFSPTERRYEIHDRELMGIIKSLQEWRHYIQGSSFTTTVLSDHKNLTYFRKPQKLNDRQARWSLILSEYDIELLHTPGEKMIQSDAISRRSDLNPTIDENHKPETMLTHDLFVRFIDLELQERITGSKEVESDVLKALETIKASEIDGDLDEWTMEETENGKSIFFKGRQYIPDELELRREIIKRFHDAVTAGHPGELETYNLVRESYWWPGLKTFVKNYVQGCFECQQFKINRRPTKPTLQPIAGSKTTEPFKQISMDFITDLPPVDGCDAIMSVVDHGLTKGIILIPTKKAISAEETAMLFLENVHKRFGLPDSIISDRGPQFSAGFFQELFKRLGVKSNLTTAFHPQSDGTTERYNQEIETYLSIYCLLNPESWKDKMATLEFAHNSKRHADRIRTPFELMYGYTPRGMPTTMFSNKFPNVQVKLEQLQKDRVEAQAAHELARVRMADRHRQMNPRFRKGDKVWLEAKNLNLPYTKKISSKREGPFVITEVMGPVNYKLKLTPRWKIHNVFHASLLSPYKETPTHGTGMLNPPPDLIDGHEEYEVEAIMKHKRSGNGYLYLTRWKNYLSESDSWEPAASFKHAQEILKEYKQRKGL